MQVCGFEIGLDQPFFLIAGPCVIESEQFALDTAGQLKEITEDISQFISKLLALICNTGSGGT